MLIFFWHIVSFFLIFCGWPAAEQQPVAETQYEIELDEIYEEEELDGTWRFCLKAKSPMLSRRKARSRATVVLAPALPTDFVTRYSYSRKLVIFSLDSPLTKRKHDYDKRGPPAVS